MKIMKNFIGGDLKRFKEVIKKISKYGFQDILVELELEKISLKKQSELQPQEVRFRILLEDLGGAFVKFGQMLSTRRDLLDSKLIQELELLQDKVKPVPFKEIKTQIEIELNQKTNKIFKSIQENPLASASIGQVHKAILQNGTQVAVKIMRPQIKQKIYRDLKIMKTILNLLKNSEILQKHGILLLFEEFERTIKKELNYKIEAKNIQLFHLNFSKNPKIITPKLYPEYTTKKILIMEYINGEKINNYIKKTKPSSKTNQTIALSGLNSFIQQIYEFNFVHGDPHPGNIFIYKNKICYLDFGNCIHITSKEKTLFLKIMNSIITKNSEKTVTLIKEICYNINFNEENLIRDIQDLFDLYYQDNLQKIAFGELIFDLIKISYEYQLNIKPQYTSLMRIIIYIEDIGRRLHPEINIINIMQPHIKKLIKKEYSPQNITKKFENFISENYTLLEKLPNELTHIFNKIKYDNFKVELKGNEIIELEHRISNTGNRISMSMIISALIISSTLSINMDFPKFLFHLPLISIIGYTLSIILGISLLLAIIRSKF